MNMKRKENHVDYLDYLGCEIETDCIQAWNKSSMKNENYTRQIDLRRYMVFRLN